MASQTFYCMFDSHLHQTPPTLALLSAVCVFLSPSWLSFALTAWMLLHKNFETAVTPIFCRSCVFITWILHIHILFCPLGTEDSLENHHITMTCISFIVISGIKASFEVKNKNKLKLNFSFFTEFWRDFLYYPRKCPEWCISLDIEYISVQ